MVIDTNRCFGCQACAEACKIANNLPKELQYNVVYTKTDDNWDEIGVAVARGAVSNDNAGGVFPNCTLNFLPMQCQHCEDPSCLHVCPTGATQKREDGIVWVDEDLCVGCRACIMACPYDGIRTLISNSPEHYLDMQVGEYDAPKHNPGTVGKCTFCKNLIDRGEVPACMQLCPGRARFWGDLDDPESEVSKALNSGKKVHVMRESMGTNPSVFYLV